MSTVETTLGVIDFSICPQLAADGMPGNSMAEAEQWAAGIPNAAYARDDQTAITVVDGEAHFVSEGHWTQLSTLSSQPDQVVARQETPRALAGHIGSSAIENWRITPTMVHTTNVSGSSEAGFADVV